MAAQTVADEYFEHGADPGVFPMHSLLDTEGEFVELHRQNKDGTATTCSESRRSTRSLEYDIALEVGLGAHEYLEECFCNEASVLDREKFDGIPEIAKSDFTITGHLGEGNFSDVFEAICKSGRLVDTSLINTIPQGVQLTHNHSAKGIRRPTLPSPITTATVARPPVRGESRFVFALKCLRPRLQSDADQFAIGAEDLVHETAMLANLNHSHIIKLHGRASGNLKNTFVLNDGYFILLDKLNGTLYGRMNEWKRSPKCTLRGSIEQVEVAYSIADAMCYLHSKDIVFRDLKPANVGFDSMGVLKLFDFGFAVGLPQKDESKNPSGLLFDRCGTPRYMAPEVGLSLGYSLPADIYSFGILTWEICALAKPFSSITSPEEFDRRVFWEGKRPTIDNCWPTALKKLMISCWSYPPSNRPTMLDVRSTLSFAMFSRNGEKKSPMKAFRSSMARRLSHNGW